MRFVWIVCLLGASSASAQQWYSVEDQARIVTRWPSSIPVPEKFRFYKSTKWVQSSAVTDFPQLGRQNVLTVGLVTRRSSEWSVPGGLRGISGWHSYLAVVRGAEIQTFDAVEPASGAFGGRLRRVDRSFEGALFFDLLLNSSFEPFELRAMVSDGLSLDPMVLWRNPIAVPLGYVRPKRRECISCHQRAGESAYATGNVPGGGGIFSYPLLTED